MNIGVIHYHLKPGGVTTVIKQHIQAAADRHNFLIISGEAPPDGRVPAPVAVVPEIGYDHADGRPACTDPDATAAAIIDRLQEQWPDGCDLLHVHNPLLAKNERFLDILRALTARGVRLLLHVHDFAEDGRPGSYYGQTAYPEDCHLAVINSRDRQILIEAGARPEGVHYIANPVNVLPQAEPPPPPEPLVLYPVRAIRRKNIGEAVLMSLFFEKQETLAVTLAPNSPADFPPYEGWKEFCRAEPFRVVFEASSRRPFDELSGACRAMVSTSITEGFGFAFLEPWTAGKPLLGRRLPDLCADFEAAGVRLDHLYHRLAVPTDWLDKSRLREKIVRTASAVRRAFGLSVDKDAVEPFAALADRETVDFGLLDESFQKQVISRLLNDTAARQRLTDRNPFLSGLSQPLDPDRIARNRQAVCEQFSLQNCGRQLTAVYDRVRRTTVTQRIDKQRLLNRFCHPDRFSLLKGGEYDPPDTP